MALVFYLINTTVLAFGLLACISSGIRARAKAGIEPSAHREPLRNF